MGLLFGILGAAAMLLAIVILAPRRGSGLPAVERGCLTLFRLAAWLERLGSAWDAAIVRYRLERMALVIDLASTREREGRRAA
jgi:hypothetical protein